jgi:hypothetical protein
VERGLAVSQELVAADLADSMEAVGSMQAEVADTAELSYWI